MVVLVVTSITLVASFSPVAGLLTDIKFSRYGAVHCSSYAIIVKIIALVVLVIVVAILNPFITFGHHKNIAIAIAIYIVVIVFVVVYVVFTVNAFQFGLDQLQDSPTEDFVLFIHWYMWIYYTCSLIAESTWTLLLYDLILIQ